MPLSPIWNLSNNPAIYLDLHHINVISQTTGDNPMQLITHNSHLNSIPASDLMTYITHRFNQISEDSDVPPTIILLEPTDELRSLEFQFIGPQGMVSDLLDEIQPGEEGFTHCFEWVSHDENLKIYEALHLEFDMGTWLIIPEAVTLAHPDLLWVSLSNLHEVNF